MVYEPIHIYSSLTTDHVLLFGYGPLVHWWSPIGKHSFGVL